MPQSVMCKYVSWQCLVNYSMLNFYYLFSCEACNTRYVKEKRTYNNSRQQHINKTILAALKCIFLHI